MTALTSAMTFSGTSPRLIAVVMTPTPIGFVRHEHIARPRASFCHDAFRVDEPVTASPYFGSGSSML